MNIYLPMKNDLLDKGEGTIWTGGGLKEPEIVRFNKVKCAKFDGNSRLRLDDTTLIKSLKKWTIQVWIYPTKIGSYSDVSFVLSNFVVGSADDSSWLNFNLKTDMKVQFGYSTYIDIASSILNAWHHVKITSDGNNMNLLIDKVNIGTMSSINTDLSKPFAIGYEAGNYGVDVGFYGYMTQFKFSDKYNDNDLPLNDSKFIYINKNNEVWAMV